MRRLHRVLWLGLERGIILALGRLLDWLLLRPLQRRDVRRLLLRRLRVRLGYHRLGRLLRHRLLR